MYNTLLTYIEARCTEFEHIDAQRKHDLFQIGQYIQGKSIRENIRFTFICTHNSRRSHMAQIWAQVAAKYYSIAKIDCYSGGTEATAFNPRAVTAMQNAGLKISAQDTSGNPVYIVSYHADAKPIKAFSKKYSDAFNPQKDYCAVMTCSDADEACPVVIGADRRITLTYEDPKKYDDSELEETKYAERCAQIAREMLYAFSQVTVK